ncbi:MAG: hypothetical protein AUH85_07210 [Chloroflexi bacterium 13_1_40CM_4_68_4]|nr:MAG: hypothetical protein AUH85_07210 [Chloroflexi bacterium 13_1_40CM_4_68_4]
MTARSSTLGEYIVLGPEDYRVLGPAEFGCAGLVAVESIGPYVEIEACGPLVTVHDSTIEPHLGIGHHPHRCNERLFYMLAGSLDHDDVLNGIRGHMGKGELGRLTEGRRGMIHSEMNNGDETAHAFIVVYATDPLPDRASFALLTDAEAPRYDEGTGVRTKELVGSRAPLRVHGDLRRYLDSVLDPGAEVSMSLGDSEGGLLWVEHGTVDVGEHELAGHATVIVPPEAGDRVIVVEAREPARILRVIFGPGYGLVRRGLPRAEAS